MTQKAIFCQATRGINYPLAIVQAHKPAESRASNMLRKLIGERVAIVGTGTYKQPVVLGYATITHAIKVSKEQFEKLFEDHLVPPGSAFDCKPDGSKWLYYLADATPCDPYPLPKDAVRHGRSWCEYERNF